MSNLPAVIQSAPVATVSTYDKVHDPMVAAEQLGNWIAKSGMFGCERPEQGAILAMQCIVERKAPLELAKHYHIIGGRLSLRADAMLALYRERGGKVQWLQFDATGAKARWVYDGNDITLSYTTDDAKQAGLLPGRPGSGWAKFPAEMLRARLISKAVRMIAPEVCTGTYTPEELEDINRPAAPVSVLQDLPQVQVDVPKPVLESVLLEAGANLDDVRRFLVDKKWIPENGTFADIQPVRSNKILAKPAAFLEAVAAHCNKSAIDSIAVEVA